jgi:hypothetical protein
MKECKCIDLEQVGGLAIEKQQELVTVALVWNLCQFEGQGVPPEVDDHRNATKAPKGLNSANSDKLL